MMNKFDLWKLLLFTVLICLSVWNAFYGLTTLLTGYLNKQNRQSLLHSSYGVALLPYTVTMMMTGRANFKILRAPTVNIKQELATHPTPSCLINYELTMI